MALDYDMHKPKTDVCIYPTYVGMYTREKPAHVNQCRVSVDRYDELLQNISEYNDIFSLVIVK